MYVPCVYLRTCPGRSSVGVQCEAGMGASAELPWPGALSARGVCMYVCVCVCLCLCVCVPCVCVCVCVACDTVTQ